MTFDPVSVPPSAPPPGPPHEPLPPYQPALPSASDEPDRETRVLRALVSGLADAWVVAVWFVVAGVVGALVWWQLTPLAEFTRNATGGTMDEEQLVQRVSSDGWFTVIGLVGGLLSGLVLVLLRRRAPLLVVLLVAAGGLLATVVMRQTGLWVGPGDPEAALAKAAVGDTVPLQLKTLAAGTTFVWSLGAMAGALVGLVVGEHRSRGDEQG